MRISDIINLCRQSLSRQKARTRLTIMGVTIGCCAIVLMMSLGLGSNEQTKVMLSNMGDLTEINIWNYGGGKKNNAITKEVIEKLRAIPNVEMVSPKQEMRVGNLSIAHGSGDRYMVEYPTMVGVAYDMPEKKKYELKSGEYLKSAGTGYGRRPISVLVGERFYYGFKDSKRPEGKNYRSYEDPKRYSEDGYNMDRLSYSTDDEEKKPYEEPFFSNMDAKLYMVMTVYDETSGQETSFRQEIKVVGIMKNNPSKDWMTGDGVFMSTEDMESCMRAVMGKKAFNEAMKNGYNQVSIKADEIKNVKAIEKAIKEMGYEPSSMESIRESINKQTRQQQIMLAGLGGISLFVAAIGIMNTMIMSITERTKEIGIMKALGCYVNDIRKIFLVEAGAIGLIGGIVGIIISLVISFLINVAGILGLVQSSSAGMIGNDASNEMGFFQKLSNIHIDLGSIYAGLTTPGNRTSIIPIWLVIFGLAFSTLIGLISGYQPANKAVKIPALEAIKHE